MIAAIKVPARHGTEDRTLLKESHAPCGFARCVLYLKY